MKTSLRPLLFLLSLLLAAHSQTCPIPPNCDTYSLTLQKCTACQQNYLLIANSCFSVSSLAALIQQQQPQTQPQTQAQQPQPTQTAQPQQAQTQTQQTQQGVFTQQQTQQPQPTLQPIVRTIANPTTMNTYGGITYTPASPILQPATPTQQTTASTSVFVPWYQQSTTAQSQSNSQASYGLAQGSSTGYSDVNCKTIDSSNTTCAQCYPYYYPDSATNKCCPVNPLCKNYTSLGQCLSCYNGYALQGGNCTISSPSTPSSPSMPSSSYSSSSITSSSSSSASSSSSSSSWAGWHHDNNCKNYLNDVCIECFASFYFNSTLSQCMATNSLCKTVTAANQCTSCYNGYQLNTATGNCDLQTNTQQSQQSTNSQQTSNSQQSSIQQSASNQQSTSSQQSTSQPTTFTQYSFGQQSFFQLGATQYLTYNGLVYQVSAQGQLVGPVTLPFSPPYAAAVAGACSAYVGSSCLSCVSRYYLTGSGCAPVDPNCYAWINNGLCLQCQTGFTLTTSGCTQTLPSQPTTSSTTSSSSGSSSPQCYTRQVLINGSCVKVSDQCKSWGSDALCTECYKGYQLSSGVCQ